MYCCAAIIIDQLNDDEQVDVFSAVREVRRSNPEFIISATQYQCLHDMVSRYLSNAAEYAAVEVTYV